MTNEQQSSGERVITGWNSVFRALAAEPRRQIIIALSEAPVGRELTLPEAANPPFALMEPERLLTELRHSHLPLLAESGFVTWRDNPFCVDRGPNFDQAAVVLRSLQKQVDDIPIELVDGCQRLEEHRSTFE